MTLNQLISNGIAVNIVRSPSNRFVFYNSEVFDEIPKFLLEKEVIYLDEGVYRLVDSVSADTSATEWIDIHDILPPFNILVAVRLTNGCTAFDFVNEPFDEVMPFQHYFVSHWRYATTDELKKVLACRNSKQ